MEYIAYLHKDKRSDYGVSFPDFPGCVTAGRSLEEARELAVEALTLHIAGMVEDGEALPEPSTLGPACTRSGDEGCGCVSGERRGPREDRAREHHGKREPDRGNRQAGPQGANDSLCLYGAVGSAWQRQRSFA